MTHTLAEITAQHPFPEYQTWWPLGETFTRYMSNAIAPEWRALDGQISTVQENTTHYLQTVYNRTAPTGLVDNFVTQHFPYPIQSGEFDALSYAFFHSAFEQMVGQKGAYNLSLPQARRHFTQRVGKTFFTQLHNHLQLDLPGQLTTEADFARLQANIDRTGTFLVQQGYLRDHFAFTFDVHVTYMGISIHQSPGEFLDALTQNGVAYALYEMGYPVILPSAVYLYHTMGEAQHHSSRTIEELFARVGCDARETDDFDPTGFPSDRVVELWEIRSPK